MPNYTLPRQERLRSLKAIRRMFGEGESGFVYPFRYVWLRVEQAAAQCTAEEEKQVAEEIQTAGEKQTEGKQAEENRRVEVMFSVPKKFHKRANRRNLLKRRTREAYRLSREPLCEHLRERGVELHLAFIYSAKECHTYKTIHHAVRRILEQVAQRV